MTFAETMWTRGYLPQMPLTTEKAPALSINSNSKVVKRACARCPPGAVQPDTLLLTCNTELEYQWTTAVLGAGTQMMLLGM